QRPSAVLTRSAQTGPELLQFVHVILAFLPLQQYRLPILTHVADTWGMYTNTYDVIIIGGSAAGLSAAQALGRSLRCTLVIDAGQPRNRYADRVPNVLGHDGRTPAELYALGRAEAENYGVEFRPATVTSMHDTDTTVTIELASGESISARALIV